jgi:hypothetical protein
MRHASLLLLALLGLACDVVLGIPSNQELDPSTANAGASGSSGGSTSVAGATGSAGVGGAALDCHPELDTSDCFVCSDTYCCAEYLDCKDDPRCGSFYKECIPGCKAAGKTYSECVVECDGKNGAGHAVFAKYNACNTQHCLAPCLNGPPDNCTTCLQASCADSSLKCTADRECDTLFHCLEVCTGELDFETCTAACKAKASQVTQGMVNAELTCAITYCAESCGSSLPF